MKLKKLVTTNFRSIAHSEVEFGEMTVLAGPQGSGKSSHLHAVCAALTGRTPHTDRRGVGLKTQIRRDQARAEVELTAEFSGVSATIKRSLTESGQQLEAPFGGKNTTARQTLLTEKLGGCDEVPDVLLDPRVSADRPADELNNILLKLLRPPLIEVPAPAKAIGIQSLASIQQVDDHIKSISEGSIRSLNAVVKNLEETIPAEPTPGELASAHQAEDDLAALDKRIQELALSAQNAQYLLDDARKHATEREQAKAIVETLPLLRAQQEALHGDAEMAQGLAVAIEHLTAQLDAAVANRRKLERAAVAQAKLPTLQKDMEKATAELQDFTSLYKAFDQDLQDAKVKCVDHGSKVLNLTNAIADLAKLSGKCPTCSRKLTDKAKAELIESLTAEKESAHADALQSEGKRQSIEGRMAEQSKRGAAARKELERLRSELATAQADAQHADLKVDSEDAIKARLSASQESVVALILKYHAEVGLDLTLRRAGDLLAGKIADAERAAKFVEAPAPDVESFELSLGEAAKESASTIDQHEAAKASAQAGRDTIRRADDYRRMANELTGHRTKREGYTMAKESLVALKNSILGGDAAKQLQAQCSLIFQEFFSQSHVILSPDGASVAPLGSQAGTPVAHLSSGQKVVFDAALRIAAAKSTGFNLLAIDDANKLAPSAREGLLRVLMASGCQVIMCTTADNVGRIPGAVVYKISNPSVWGPTKVERVA